LKTELFDHPLHAADADLPSALTQLLGNHFGRSLGVEEAVSDYLPDDFGGSPVIGLGAPFLAQ